MEKNNIEIIEMSDNDLLVLKDSLTNEFDDFWTYNILKQEFDNDNTTYIVAKEDDNIVGFAGILVILDEANIMNIVTKKIKESLVLVPYFLKN